MYQKLKILVNWTQKHRCVVRYVYTNYIDILHLISNNSFSNRCSINISVAGYYVS